jgi:alcohol dehydrogenase, propanol-preferring
MKAMVLSKLVSLKEVDTPLELADIPTPEPGQGQVLIKVSACGVCHTELDEIEGRTPPPRLPIVLGHQVVGRVAGLGSGSSRYSIGQRVGVGWIHSSTGESDENLSEAFEATGRDVNGGYAEHMTVGEHYAYPIPDVFSDVQAAPLLCAGAVGYRAIKLTNLRNGQRLGLTGFGGSGHLVLQFVRYQFPDSEVYVFARDPKTRDFARSLGAAWTGDTGDKPPHPLHAIIDTTPAWRPVVEAMHNLEAGGRLVINAIRKEDADKDCLMQLSYSRDLWMEREIKTVANVTSADIAEFLPLAAQIPLVSEVSTYHLAEANRALVELKRGPVKGAKVLVVA